MVWTSGIWTVKPGREDEFAAAWAEFAEWSLREFPGGRAWLLRQRDQPRVFMSIGPWPSDEIVGEWRGSVGFQERIGRIREMLDGFEPRTFDEVAAIA
jgi:heme-degrading monooxygenase HmoA